MLDYIYAHRNIDFSSPYLKTSFYIPMFVDSSETPFQKPPCYVSMCFKIILLKNPLQ